MNEARQQFNDNAPVKVALDVGTTKVVAVAGRFNEHRKIEAIDYAILQNTGMVQGEIFNLMETSQTIKHVMDELAEKTGRKFDKVTVGISGDHIRAIYTREYIIRENPNDLILEEDIEALNNLAKKSIPIDEQEEILEVIPQGYMIDNKVVKGSPIGTIGKRFEASFLVIVGKNKKIEKLIRSVNMAGLEIEDIYLQPIASAKAVLKEPQCHLGVALIDIGGGTTDILICNNGAVRFTGIIPFGGDYLTEEIYRHFHIEPKTAESIKLKYGTALLSNEDKKKVYRLALDWTTRPFEFRLETLSNLIRVKLDQIVHQIDQFIDHYQTFFPGEKINLGVVVTGGGSQLKNIIQYLQYKLGRDVVLGKPGILLAPSPLNEKLAKPQFATVIGLLQLALEKAEKNRELQAPQNERNHSSVREGEQSYTAPEEETSRTMETEQEPAEGKKRNFFTFLQKIFANAIDEASQNQSAKNNQHGNE